MSAIQEKKLQKSFVARGQEQDLTCTVVNARSIHSHLPLLEEAYQNLYLPNFSPDAGNDTMNFWLKHMCAENSAFLYTIAIVSDTRDATKKTPGKPVAMMVSFFCKDSCTSHLLYLVVDPEYRIFGLGKSLFEFHSYAMQQSSLSLSSPLKGSFLACPNPDLEGDDTYDPQKRLKKYLSWGLSTVPIKFMLPASEGNAEKKNTLILLEFPRADKGRTSHQVLIQHLASLYKLWGVHDPYRNPEFCHMVKCNLELSQ